MKRLIHLSTILFLLFSQRALAEPVAVGSGSYENRQPRAAQGPPENLFVTAAIEGKIPTNDWWSSVVWMPFSERQYPHPLAVQAEPRGLWMFYPGNHITANKDAIFGFMPPAAGDLLLGHSQQQEFKEARLDGFSDWFVRVKFAVDEKTMTLTYGHGSPFVYARFRGGHAQLTFSRAPEVWSGDGKSAALGITIGGKHYGIFGPARSNWQGLGGNQLICNSEKDYCSIAILPNNEPATLKLFAKYAHAHVTDSKIDYQYDEETSQVATTFSLSTESLEGEESNTLLALYPHQWRYAADPLLDLKYNSVRGEMKLFAGASFRTRQTFSGVLPGLPHVGGCEPAVVAKMLAEEAAEPAPPIKDTYWDGKWLGRKATLIPIAEAYGELEIAKKLREQLKARLENWLTAANEQGAKTEQLFWYERNWGTLIGHPASFGSDVELNDHHFHYGYFIRAAAEIVRREPQWAEKWGGMIELLLRDFASGDRSDPLFPHLRNFDPYAGHSWASGHAKFGDGNNNESSSEAMNAWYGMILWGEFTGNKKLRDLGVYLYTTEMTAIHEYWFDVHGTNHPADFTPAVVTMVWGGKGANGTWFSGNPEVVHGINWLPLHGGSLYLGHYAEYAEKNYSALRAENDNQPFDEWVDLIWMYRAFSDPADALRQYEAGKQSAPRESGNSPANTYHWIGSLGRLGKVNRNITAAAPLFAVFDSGKKRTYIVYCQKENQSFRFSDGFTLDASKSGLVTAEREIEGRD